MEIKINVLFLVMLLFVGIIVGLGVSFVFMQDSPPENITKAFADGAYSRESEINELNSRVIELQENAKYSTEELKKTRLDKEDLQLVYNDLFTDAASCYYANYCLYYEEACLETLGSLYPGYSALEIHYMESDWCDGMYRDWEEYQLHDSSLAVEK